MGILTGKNYIVKGDGSYLYWENASHKWYEIREREVPEKEISREDILTMLALTSRTAVFEGVDYESD